MRVDPHDGCCRECGGTLDVIGVTDDTIEVSCTECAESYEVETDAFGDGAMTYWPEAMARKLQQGGDGDEPA